MISTHHRLVHGHCKRYTHPAAKSVNEEEACHQREEEFGQAVHASQEQRMCVSRFLTNQGKDRDEVRCNAVGTTELR